MGQQRVDQRVLPVARGRVDDESRRLVDDDDRIVLIHDIERDLLRPRLGRHRRGNRDVVEIPRFDPPGGVGYRRPAARNMAVLDQRLEAGPGDRGAIRRQQPVQAHSALAGPGGDTEISPARGRSRNRAGIAIFHRRRGWTGTCRRSRPS